MIITGIDPGKSGGLWRWDSETNEVSILNMPTDPVYEVDGFAIACFVHGADHVFLEWATGRTGQHAGPSVAMGKNMGVVKGAVDAMQVPIKLLSPKTWTHAMGVIDKKMDPKLKLRHEIFKQLWPNHHHLVIGKCGGIGDGLMDAGLICYYGRMVLGLI